MDRRARQVRKTRRVKPTRFSDPWTGLRSWHLHRGTNKNAPMERFVYTQAPPGQVSRQSREVQDFLVTES